MTVDPSSQPPQAGERVSVPPPGWEDAPSPWAQAPTPVIQPAAPVAEPGFADRWRRFILLGAVTAGVLAAVYITSIRGGDAGNTPLSPIAAAAERTAAAPGVRVAGTGQLNAGGESMNMSFTGEFDGASQRSSMRMEMSSAAVSSTELAQISPMVAVTDGTRVYMTAPAFSSQLPDGKSWMSIDYSQFAGDVPEQQSATDAHAMLEELRAAGSDTRAVGTERVRGVKTTHYTGTIDMDIPAEDGTGTSNVDVWVDGKGYVRRVGMNVMFTMPGSAPAQIAITMDYFDFGVEPRIGVPAESETYDATELARQGLEAAS